MTIDEAINEQADMILLRVVRITPQRESALNLGIEALKYCKESKKLSDYFKYPKLPGETEK